MTGRHLCGFYAVTVPDGHRMYARKEAEGNTQKSPNQESTSQPFSDVLGNLTGTSEVNSKIRYNSTLGFASENPAKGKQTLM